MNNKVVENIITVVVFIVILILAFSFTVEKSKEATEKLYKSPLARVTILDNTLNLEEDQRTYIAVVDCSQYEENTQVIDYKLNAKYDVNVSSYFYKDSIVLDNPSPEMTNFDINLSLRNDKQEIVYHFELTCGDYNE